MLTAVHALALASLLVLPPARRTSAAPAMADTSALQFHGFRAGARLDELSMRLRGMGGGPMHCRRARTDHRVTECRAALSDLELGGKVDLWISAIDSVAGVITLSAMVAPGQLDRWRHALQERYGHVGARTQGTQSMLQWVRRGRMIRLTWRLEGGGKIASVSLVDGHVLDSWGRARSRTTDGKSAGSAPALSSRAGPDSSPRSPPACSPERRGPTPSTHGAAPSPECVSARRRQRDLGR
jgi:hypothetical protein